MRAARAYRSNIEFQCCCADINIRKWDQLMDGAVKANGSKIRGMIKNQLPELYESLSLDFYNPYEAQSQRTKTHLVYVHSAIEYFLEIQ